MSTFFNPKSCFSCVPLRLGTLIIGYLSLFSAVATLLYVIIAGATYTENEQANACFFRVLYLGKDQCNQLTKAELITTGVEEFIRGGFSILLLIGVHKLNSSMMLPFLVFNGIMLVVSALMIIAFTILFAIFGAWIISLIIAIVGSTCLVIVIHLYMVVRAYRDEITVLEQEEPARKETELK